MKRWLCLLLAGLGVCLLLALGRWQAVKGLHRSRHLAGWTRCMNAWGELLPIMPVGEGTVEKPEPGQGQAAGRECHSLHPLLPEPAVGPRWLDSRGPPDKAVAFSTGTGLPVRPVAQDRGAPLTIYRVQGSMLK
jgi:hypothetical protein